MKISVTHNLPQVMAALSQLDPKVAQQVFAGTLNKTLDQAKTAMAREIVANYAVSSSYVKGQLRVSGASAKQDIFSMEARLIAGNGMRRAVNIVAFVEKSTTLAQARKRGKLATLKQIHVRVKKGGGFKPLPGAFIGNKGRTVFERVGKERLPIRPVQVIDVPQMFNATNINSKVLKFIREKLLEIFKRELLYWTERASRVK